eukprot:393036_1
MGDQVDMLAETANCVFLEFIPFLKTREHEIEMGWIVWKHFVLSGNHILMINAMKDKHLIDDWILWGRTKFKSLFIKYGNDLHDMAWYGLLSCPTKFKIAIENGVDASDNEESMELGGCIIKGVLKHNNKGIIKVDNV